MSKKSRKRNKKILAAIGIGLGAAALASRNKRNASIQANETKEAGSAETGKKFEDQSYSTGPKKDTAKKDTAVTTKTTIQDNKKIRNPKTIYVKKNTNKVFKGKDGPDKAVVGNEKSNFKGDDGYIRRGKDATPMTSGRYGTARAASEISKGALPPQLRAPKKPETFGSRNDGLSYMAKGGRAEYKSGGKVKGCGKALRGFGKAMKGNR